MKQLLVQAGNFEYPYYVGNKIENEIIEWIINQQFSSALVITDPVVNKQFAGKFIRDLGSNLEVYTIQIIDGEKNKNLLSVNSFVEEAIKSGITRTSCVITYGGGVVSNIGGAISSLLFHGLPLIHIPTTTVAMFDNAISVRQALNSAQGKNQVGTIYAPSAVFCDVHHLESLPEKGIQEGIIEVVKGAFVSEQKHLDKFIEVYESRETNSEHLVELVDLAIDVKVDAIINDPSERKIGLKLHYGHTLGHAIEYLMQPDYSHGESVAIGMECAALISNNLGYLSHQDLKYHNELLHSIMPKISYTPIRNNIKNIINILPHDAKQGLLPINNGNIAFVLLKAMGNPIISHGLPLTYVPVKHVESVLTDLISRS